MKVQHITEKWVCGGIESLLIDLCAATESSDILNSVAYLYEDHWRGQIPSAVRAIGVRMIQKLRIDPIGLWRLRKLIRDEQPDVLHCHAYYPAACALALRTAGVSIPIVYTVHANLERGLQRSDAFVARVVRSCERVVAVSCSTAESIQKFTNGLVSARVISNGIDLARIASPASFSADAKRRSVGIGDRTLVLSMVAVLTNQKDHPTLLRAFANLARDGRDRVLLIIGDGQERESLETLARDLGLGGTVRFLGKRDDVAEWLAISHIFVLASHGEGLPISIIEASCAGLPVVATGVGGVPDLVNLGIDVRLTRHADVDDLTIALREVAESLSTSGSERRQVRSREMFTIKRAAEQYRDLYRELHSRWYLQ